MNCAKPIFFAILGVSLLLTNACDSIERSYDEYLNQGINYYTNGEFSKATIELQNAIQKNPEAADPHYYLALVNEKSQNFRAMRLNLQQTLKLKPDHVEAREKLAKVNLIFNDLDQALAEVDAIQQIQPDNPAAKTISAQILERQQKSDEAMALVSEVLEKNPDFVDALALKTVLMLKNQKYDEGLETVEHGLLIDGDNVSLHLLKIQLHGLKNDLAAVIQDYQALIKIQPANDEIKYALTKAYVKHGNNRQAETLLRNLIADKPNSNKAKLMLLELLSVTSRDAAFAQFDDFLASSNPTQQIELVKWVLAKGYRAKAKELLSKIAEQYGDDEQAKQTALYMLAGMSFQQKDFKHSAELTERLLKVNPDHTDAKVLKAAILLSEDNKVEDAEELLNNILWEQPRSDGAMVLLGKIYLLRGERDKANNKFLDAFKINPANKQALLPLVDQALKNSHNDYAKELLQTASTRGAQGFDLLQMLAKINMAENDWDAAEKIIKVIERRKNGQLLGWFLTAQMLGQQEKYEQSAEQYRRLLQKYPWHAASLAALASSYEKLGKRDQMQRFLADFSKTYPNNSAARLLSSRFLVLENKTDKAIELLTNYLATNPTSVSIGVELARLHLAQGDRKAAFEVYQEGLQQKPNNIKLLMSLASFYEQQRQPESAIELYEKVLTIDPTMDVAKNNLAAILLEQGTAEAIAKAVALTSKFRQSEQPYFLDSYAWAQFKNNNINDALPALKRVITLAPNIPVFRYHLAQIYQRQGNVAAAITELREALDLGKQSPFIEAGTAKKLLDSLLVSR